LRAILSICAASAGRARRHASACSFALEFGFTQNAALEIGFPPTGSGGAGGIGSGKGAGEVGVLPLDLASKIGEFGFSEQAANTTSAAANSSFFPATQFSF
jgi:hypothetical protein